MYDAQTSYVSDMCSCGGKRAYTPVCSLKAVHTCVKSALQAILKAFLLSINSPPIYTNIHIDNIGVINRSSNTPFSIPQCLLPDWYIFKSRPCNSVALSLGPLRYNTSKAIRTVTQALLRSSPLPARLNILADAGYHKHIQTAPLFTKHPLYPPHQWK